MSEIVPVKCLDCGSYQYAKEDEVKDMKCIYCGFPKKKKGLRIVKKG